MKRLLVGLLMIVLNIVPVTAQDSSPIGTGTDGLPWWNDRVFYEIFVRSFEDSDGDGTGDLQGIINRLDYLNDGDPATSTDLGITGIWLMPIMTSPSYHGYDVTDYMTVEPDYGTNEDFKALIEAAHERGIAVIVDMVVNHTSREHPWFVDAQTPGSTHDSWYRWSLTRPGQIGPWGQQVWYGLGNRYYYAVFWDGMPDLNLRNPAVTQAVHQITDFWLNDMAADGFRLDGARYYLEDENTLASAQGTLTWLGRWNEYITSIKPDAFTVGEVWTNSFEVAQYVPGTVDLAFEFDVATGMMRAADTGSNSPLLPVQERALRLYPPGQYAPFLTNHDQNRVMSELNGDVNKAKVAASLLLTNWGVPFLYYGEEIGMIGVKPDECLRTGMQWDSDTEELTFMAGKRCTTNAPASNVADQIDDPDSLLSHYRDLIHLRNAHPALRAGTLQLVESSDPAIYSFIRFTQTESVLVVINLSGEAITEYSLTLEQGPFSGIPPVELLMGEGEVAVPTFSAIGGFDAYTPLAELKPFSTIIIKLNQPG